jgi:hypothetical protein
MKHPLPNWDLWADAAPFLEPLGGPWKPVPRIALTAWLLFYGVFLYDAARGTGFLLFMDDVFVPIHEGGHLLFHYFGTTIGIAGGTILQLFVPFALAAYFVYHREAQGVAFCLFFFFEQCLPIATYMADARAQQLPLLTVDDSSYVIHDWNYLFSKLGVLQDDTVIANWVRFIGWIGMIAVILWLIWRAVNEDRVKPAENSVT